ncbi:MAG: hypothetical protein EA362_05230 [Saprospirales bacterium]|nr:MAG: hypothetical protein EA362_05230 [Saprospirales bacterium]
MKMSEKFKIEDERTIPEGEGPGDLQEREPRSGRLGCAGDLQDREPRSGRVARRLSHLVPKDEKLRKDFS